MAQKHRKTKKMRGSRTHGYGNAQKHRGAGSRGGRGLSGSAKQKWSYISKYRPGWFGNRGFHRPISQQTVDLVTNVGWLSTHMDWLVKEGFAKADGDSYSLDLTQTDYTKLLGSGKVNLKMNIKVGKCTEKAKNKVEAAGGAVEVVEGDDFVEMGEDDFVEVEGEELVEESGDQ